MNIKYLVFVAFILLFSACDNQPLPVAVMYEGTVTETRVLSHSSVEGGGGGVGFGVGGGMSVYGGSGSGEVKTRIDKVFVRVQVDGESRLFHAWGLLDQAEIAALLRVGDSVRVRKYGDHYTLLLGSSYANELVWEETHIN